MIRYDFAGGTYVEVWDNGTTTRIHLASGKKVWGYPHYDSKEYRQKAIECGYGDHPNPCWALCREHELTHCFLAEKRDLRESRTIRAVADGQALEHLGSAPKWQWIEETEVIAWQKFLNSGDHNNDPGGILSALRDEIGDLYEARQEFIDRFRNYVPTSGLVECEV